MISSNLRYKRLYQYCCIRIVPVVASKSFAYFDTELLLSAILCVILLVLLYFVIFVIRIVIGVRDCLIILKPRTSVNFT